MYGNTILVMMQTLLILNSILDRVAVVVKYLVYYENSEIVG